MGVIVKNQTIEQILEEASVGFARPPARQIIAGSVVRGGAPLRDVKFGGRRVSVSPGADIQRAIDTVNNAGGGTVLLGAGTHTPTAQINGASKVSLVGEGKDLTILDFAGKLASADAGIKYRGTSSVFLESFELKGFTVQNCDTGNNEGVYLIYCKNFIISNIRSSTNTNDGFNVWACQDFLFENCLADTNEEQGWQLWDNGTTPIKNYTMINCIADGNGTDSGSGFWLSTDNHENFTFINCRSDNNSLRGFYINFTQAAQGLFLGCRADGNSGDGFRLDGEATLLVGCQATNNSADGFDISGQDIILIGCYAEGNGAQDFDTLSLSTGEHAILLGCRADYGAAVVPSSTIATIADSVQSSYNIGIGTKTQRRIVWMKNTSGGNLVAGDVVAFKAVANGDEITTTTTQGDDLIFGMLQDAIVNNEYGPVLVEGYTQVLKVDGTTDIAIGDFLGAFTTAKIAMKAAAGDMAFAIALEAYSTDDSSGVINALLIVPRKI